MSLLDGRGICRRQFPTTSWSVVLSAGRDSSHSQQALALLCETYWRPVFAYVRRKGHDPEEAKDLTQEFFARMIEKRYLADAQQERGRFRSFLLSAISHFLTNEWDRNRAQKRGAGNCPVSLDFDTIDGQRSIDPSDNITPETLFERQWALALLERVIARLRDEFARKGRGDQFVLLKVFLTEGQDRGSYTQLASELEVSEGAAKVAVHRLRRRYGELLREEIAQTVASPGEIEEEIQYLIRVLAEL